MMKRIYGSLTLRELIELDPSGVEKKTSPETDPAKEALLAGKTTIIDLTDLKLGANLGTMVNDSEQMKDVGKGILAIIDQFRNNYFETQQDAYLRTYNDNALLLNIIKIISLYLSKKYPNKQLNTSGTPIEQSESIKAALGTEDPHNMLGYETLRAFVVKELGLPDPGPLQAEYTQDIEDDQNEKNGNGDGEQQPDVIPQAPTPKEKPVEKGPLDGFGEGENPFRKKKEGEGEEERKTEQALPGEVGSGLEKWGNDGTVYYLKDNFVYLVKGADVQKIEVEKFQRMFAEMEFNAMSYSAKKYSLTSMAVTMWIDILKLGHPDIEKKNNELSGVLKNIEEKTKVIQDKIDTQEVTDKEYESYMNEVKGLMLQGEGEKAIVGEDDIIDIFEKIYHDPKNTLEDYDQTRLNVLSMFRKDDMGDFTILTGNRGGSSDLVKAQVSQELLVEKGYENIRTLLNSEALIKSVKDGTFQNSEDPEIKKLFKNLGGEYEFEKAKSLCKTIRTNGPKEGLTNEQIEMNFANTLMLHLMAKQLKWNPELRNTPRGKIMRGIVKGMFQDGLWGGDETLGTAIKWGKELAIQGVCLAISGGLANLAVRGVRTVVRAGRALRAGTTAEQYIAGASFGVRGLDFVGSVALEGTIFHAAHAITHNLVKMGLGEESHMREELIDRKGYAKSIAFMAVLKGIHGAIGKLTTKKGANGLREQKDRYKSFANPNNTVGKLFFKQAAEGGVKMNVLGQAIKFTQEGIFLTATGVTVDVGYGDRSWSERTREELIQGIMLSAILHHTNKLTGKVFGDKKMQLVRNPETGVIEIHEIDVARLKTETGLENSQITGVKSAVEGKKADGTDIRTKVEFDQTAVDLVEATSVAGAAAKKEAEYDASGWFTKKREDFKAREKWKLPKKGSGKELSVAEKELAAKEGRTTERTDQLIKHIEEVQKARVKKIGHANGGLHDILYKPLTEEKVFRVDDVEFDNNIIAKTTQVQGSLLVTDGEIVFDKDVSGNIRKLKVTTDPSTTILALKVEEIIKPDGNKEFAPPDTFEVKDPAADYNRATDPAMPIEEIALITKTVNQKNIITRPFTEAEVEAKIEAYAQAFDMKISFEKDSAALAEGDMTYYATDANTKLVEAVVVTDMTSGTAVLKVEKTTLELNGTVYDTKTEVIEMADFQTELTTAGKDITKIKITTNPADKVNRENLKTETKEVDVVKGASADEMEILNLMKDDINNLTIPDTSKALLTLTKNQALLVDAIHNDMHTPRQKLKDDFIAEDCTSKTIEELDLFVKVKIDGSSKGDKGGRRFTEQEKAELFGENNEKLRTEAGRQEVVNFLNAKGDLYRLSDAEIARTTVVINRTIDALGIKDLAEQKAIRDMLLDKGWCATGTDTSGAGAAIEIFEGQVNGFISGKGIDITNDTQPLPASSTREGLSEAIKELETLQGQNNALISGLTSGRDKTVTTDQVSKATKANADLQSTKRKLENRKEEKALLDYDIAKAEYDSALAEAIPDTIRIEESRKKLADSFSDLSSEAKKTKFSLHKSALGDYFEKYIQEKNNTEFNEHLGELRSLLAGDAKGVYDNGILTVNGEPYSSKGNIEVVHKRIVSFLEKFEIDKGSTDATKPKEFKHDIDYLGEASFIKKEVEQYMEDRIMYRTFGLYKKTEGGIETYKPGNYDRCVDPGAPAREGFIKVKKKTFDDIMDLCGDYWVNEGLIKKRLESIDGDLEGLTSGGYATKALKIKGGDREKINGYLESGTKVANDKLRGKINSFVSNKDNMQTLDDYAEATFGVTEARNGLAKTEISKADATLDTAIIENSNSYDIAREQVLDRIYPSGRNYDLGFQLAKKYKIIAKRKQAELDTKIAAIRTQINAADPTNTELRLTLEGEIVKLEGEKRKLKTIHDQAHKVNKFRNPEGGQIDELFALKALKMIKQTSLDTNGKGDLMSYGGTNTIQLLSSLLNPLKKMLGRFTPDEQVKAQKELKNATERQQILKTMFSGMGVDFVGNVLPALLMGDIIGAGVSALGYAGFNYLSYSLLFMRLTNTAQGRFAMGVLRYTILRPAFQNYILDNIPYSATSYHPIRGLYHQLSCAFHKQLNPEEKNYEYDLQFAWMEGQMNSIEFKKDLPMRNEYKQKLNDTGMKNVLSRVYRDKSDLRDFLNETRNSKDKRSKDPNTAGKQSDPNSPAVPKAPETLSDDEKALIITSIGDKTAGLGYYIQNNNPNQSLTDAIKSLSNEKLIELKNIYLKQGIDISDASGLMSLFVSGEVLTEDGKKFVEEVSNWIGSGGKSPIGPKKEPNKKPDVVEYDDGQADVNFREAYTELSKEYPAGSHHKMVCDALNTADKYHLLFLNYESEFTSAGLTPEVLMSNKLTTEQKIILQETIKKCIDSYVASNRPAAVEQY